MIPYTYDPQRKSATAYHEAGHLIVAAHQGFRTGKIQLQDNANGHAVHYARPDEIGSVEYDMKRLRVLLGGAVAQCLILAPNDETCALSALETGNANNDYKLARGHALAVAKASGPHATDADASTLLQEQLLEVRGILERNHSPLLQLGQLAEAKFREMEEHDTDDFENEPVPEIDAATIAPILTALVL